MGIRFDDEAVAEAEAGGSYGTAGHGTARLDTWTSAKGRPIKCNCTVIYIIFYSLHNSVNFQYIIIC